jgi:predicted O-methyltransferase YrrM
MSGSQVYPISGPLLRVKRALGERLGRRSRPLTAGQSQAPQQVAPEKSIKTLPADFAHLWDEKRLTHDMTTSRIATWVKVLGPYRHAVRSILEIGSWEGQSATFWLEFFPECHLTCLDHFQGSPKEHHGDTFADRLPGVEERFDLNVKPYGDRVEKVKSHSTPALHAMKIKQRKFDLIYVDGNHERDEVMLDSVLSWQCLKTNGIIIWDDYDMGGADADIPRSAIDMFIALQRDEIRMLHKTDEQVFALRAEKR